MENNVTWIFMTAGVWKERLLAQILVFTIVSDESIIIMMRLPRTHAIVLAAVCFCALNSKLQEPPSSCQKQPPSPEVRLSPMHITTADNCEIWRGFWKLWMDVEALSLFSSRDEIYQLQAWIAPWAWQRSKIKSQSASACSYPPQKELKIISS